MSARSGIVSFVAISTIAWGAPGCNPYERRSGEFQAGSVDPAKFPPEYLGEGGVGSKPGTGYFAPTAAKVKGQDLHYFYFPLSAAQAQRQDPLLLGDSGLQPPLGYVFDPGQKPACKAPPGYVYQPQTDAVYLDQQGAILTDLPDDTDNYVPLVRQVPVISAGEPCQDIKSEATLLTRADVRVPKDPAPAELPDALPTGKPDGTILAWAIIDPAARVLRPGQSPDDTSVTGLGLQRWGWYNHYLAAYLDGGAVPTTTSMGQTRLATQRLYYPDTVLDDAGQPAPSKRGAGYDVLQAARGEAGYSPLCAVYAYTPKDPAALAQDEKDVVPLAEPGSVVATGDVVYCLQLDTLKD